MRIQQWAWLIGMSEEPDAALLVRARSYATPPPLEVAGARYTTDAYSLQRYKLEWNDAIGLLGSVREFLRALPGQR